MRKKILQTAIYEKADIIGLTGLITQSLDEMVNFASEMERLNVIRPLLIGDATTSPVHTADKIESAYSKGPVLRVNDASRAVGVVSKLLSDTGRYDFLEGYRDDYTAIREFRARNQASKTRVPIETARSQSFTQDWVACTPRKPTFIGAREITASVADLIDYIDWTPFFASLEI